jgi:translation elongation factor EF-Ts
MKKSRQNLPREALAALEKGNKIEAIRHLREANNIGLKDAKDAIEEYLQDMPNLRARMTAAGRESGDRGLGWVALGAVVALAAYYVHTG